MKVLLKQVSFFRKCLSFPSENIWHSNNVLFQRVKYFRCFMAGTSNSDYDSSNSERPFLPQKALILTKFSRYEFEKRRHANLSEDELINNLEERGSDYHNLLQHHEIHTKNRELVVRTLEENGIETKVVNRFDYSDTNIEWADIIITTGGDGTFLMAASKIRSRNKPLIGINSDPTRSLGYLCLPTFYTENFPEALNKLKSGDFRWMHRQRIKVTLTGEHAFDQPIELHDQQLQYPEYRFLDCIEGHHKKNSPKVPKLEAKHTHELPVRALNEVFIGESLSSRVSYYEFSIDSVPKEKIKSSGLTVCTGTGSTSWSFNINKVTEQCVKHLLKITSQETQIELPYSNPDLIAQITSKFNNSLIFDAKKQLMAYTIRDPIVFDEFREIEDIATDINILEEDEEENDNAKKNGMGFKSKPRGFAKRIEIKSRMFDACLVIDGGLSFAFNDGSTAVLEINDEDALLTVSLPE